MRIAITGHRPVLLDCGYDESHPVCQAIKAKLEEQISEILAMNSPEYLFRVPMSMGVGIWAAEIVLQFKRDNPSRNIKLTVVIPYINHIKEMLDDMWCRRYELVTEAADEVVTLEPKYTGFRIEAANRWLVDNSDSVFAVFNNAADYAAKAREIKMSPVNCITARNGTAYTVRYALQCRKPVTAMDPRHPELTVRFMPKP